MVLEMTFWGIRLPVLTALVVGALSVPTTTDVATAAATAAAPVPRSADPTVPMRLERSADGLSALDVRLTADRLGKPLRTSGFDLVGVTWQGTAPPVIVRTRADGRWSGWRATTVITDGPDRGTAEHGSVSGTDLLWAGGADRVVVDVQGPAPRGLKVTLMQVPTSATAGAAASRSAATGTAAKAGAGGNTFRPRYYGRKAWGADPSLRSGRPTYNRTIQQLHVHHTVNSNDYTAAEVPGLIRGMYRYHTRNLGWSDIGYNFLVDRFGRLWTGRAGGARRPVRGAHTLGFNSTSTGVAVIGNFETGKPSQKVLTALVHLAAWKLNKYDRRPRGKVKVFSHGSDRYSYGRKVRLPVLDGHRDTNQTACPGTSLYRRLPGVRRRAAERIARFRG